jgi:hypothetical protein
MITQDLGKLVAVASGTRAQVRRWGDLLRKAAIEFHMAKSVDDGDDGDSRAELWVLPEDAEEARIALQRSRKKGESPLW